MRLKYFLLIATFSSIIYAKTNNYICSDSAFTRLRTTDFSLMSKADIEYYQKVIVDCKDDSMCHDKNITTLMCKDVSHMTDNEYEIFHYLIKTCDTINPCSLFQCEMVKAKDKNSLSRNEIDFCKFCNSACVEYGEKYYPSKKQKMKKACIFSLILLSSFSAIFGGGILLFAP